MDDGAPLPLHRLPRHRPRDQESGPRLTYDYHEPGDWPAALALLAQRGDEAAVLAGGTAFTLLLRQGLIRPASVVALRKVRDAGRIDVDGHGGVATCARAAPTPRGRSA